MTFKELLDSVTFEEVAPCLLQMHPDAEGNLKWYKIHFDMLRQVTPKYDYDDNCDVCNIFWAEWKDRVLHLTADTIKDAPWEYALTKELKIDPDVKSTNAEIVACCLWHTSYYGFVKDTTIDDFEFDKSFNGYEEWWKSAHYFKARANSYFSFVRKLGGYVPSVKEIAPFQRRELLNQLKKHMEYRKKNNKRERKKRLRREFMDFYYEYMTNICKFIILVNPALSDERNSISILQLCGLFQSYQFVANRIISYADENSNGAKFLYELLEMEDIHTRLDRFIVVLTTGEWHEEVTEDERKLCELLIGDGKSSDILLATDLSLGRQVRIDYATFNSKEPL